MQETPEFFESTSVLPSEWDGLTLEEAQQLKVAAVSEVLGLPETLIPLNTIVIGYPDGEVTPKDKWQESNISYNMYEEE